MTTKYLDENGLRHLLSEIRSDVTPIKDGTAAVGTSKKLAKADHVHPKVTPSDIGASPTSHTHGNITSGGALQTNDITVANGDKLVVTDASDSNKVARASLAFSTASEDSKKVLKQSGTFEALEATDIWYDTNVTVDEAITGKVDKVSGKGLSTNDFTTTLKNKLDGIASGAEVNVQSDWSQTTTTADDYIKNKPTIPSANSTATNIKMDGTQSAGSLATFAKADHVHPTDTSRAPLASPALTGTPTAPTATAGTNTTQIATTAFVKAAVDAAATGAVAYQGTVPISGQTGGFAPTNTTAGWYWIVQTAGTYAGEVCEAGDMIFCSTSASAYSASNFDVIQTNLDIATMTNAEIEAAISA